MNISESVRCPECGGSSLINDYHTGEQVCEGCGYVVSSISIDQGPEYRVFDLDQRNQRTRVGAPSTFTVFDKGLSTVIDQKGKDAYGKEIPAEKKIQMDRLRKWDQRSKTKDTVGRNLSVALSELRKTAYKLNLPNNVLETASYIYRQAIQKDMIKGRSIEGMSVASLYLACRQCNVARSIEEIVSVTRVSKKELARNYRFLVRRLEKRAPPVEAARLVSKYVNLLKLSGNVEKLAVETLDIASKNMLTAGRSPAGISAAAIYITSHLIGEPKTQSKIAGVSNVTEVTVRNRYHELIKKITFAVSL